MNKLNQLSKKGWQFVSLTAALSTIPYAFIISEGSIESDWALLLMWMPGIAGIALRLYHREGLFTGLNWNPLKNFKWFLIAVFVPLILETVSILLTLAVGAAELKPDFITMESGMVSIKGVAMLLGAAKQPWYIFVPNYLLSYFVGAVFYSLLFAFGEEFGWRGYLQKEWGKDTSIFPYLIIGLIWGWWHLPGILLGHNFPDYPILGGLVLMPLVTVGLSIAFGIKFQHNKVIWIPVLFHGALNISAEVTNTAVVEDSLNRPLNDMIWIGLWLILASIICFNESQKKD